MHVEFSFQNFEGTEMNKEIRANPTGKAKGGTARAASLTPERRKEISMIAVKAKKDRMSLPKATHGSSDKPLKIGDIEIPCYVLEDGTRVLSQRGLISGIGMSSGSTKSGDARQVAFFDSDAIKPFVINGLSVALNSPIKFIPPHGGKPAHGYPATILADICETVLAARQVGALPKRQLNVAEQCEALVRGFARVGIIALVDEATGYQRDRARDELAKILEAFVAKELQPYVRAFPALFYEHMFRLRGLAFDKSSVRRPMYFGHLTNDIIYRRLAPGVLVELKELSKKNKKGHLHGFLTQEIGHPKLKDLVTSVTTVMRLSKDWVHFKEQLDQIHSPFNETMPLNLDLKDDTGKGI